MHQLQRKPFIHVTKLFTFDSAHRLDDYIGKCANLHGHTYKLEVTFRGKTDRRGIVVDFGDIKKIVNDLIISKYDHQFLNDHFSFHTTAENLAVKFFELLYDHIALQPSEQSITLTRLRLWETPTSYAEVTLEDFLHEGQ
ncbi:6-carboxytetrahydropterin synthase QueD [Fodinisporobacter ferrooxydans]|uniref:6-carboxy-5,6,7,8-tetrahydropterin synthase n=1 Tax=Fodinisporobacter ferrooxydans TaxID=2901836 RepID=A0ABY4CMS9_9BACL|nr:6-carboxytetrahydropterin synthase QueD [Alicyclobacillaceae bacterium MYW30-H2]